MDQTWRDQMLPASFRGISFLIPQASVPVGMKVQLHEFPQRDEPYAEQMGKQAQVHRLVCWIIGDDCFERRDKFMEAVQTPGAGELVHPWLGRMQVKAGEAELTHDFKQGGMAAFAVTFYPDIPLKFPTAKVNTQQQVVKASDSLLDSALARYKSAMAKVDQARLGLARLRNSLSGVYTVIQQQFSTIIGAFTNLTGFVQSLMNAPDSLSSLFSSYFSEFSVDDYLGDDSGSSYRNSVATATQQTEAVASINTVSDSGGVDAAAASQATANLVQDALLVQVALIISEMPVASQPVSTATVASVEQQAVQPIVRPEVPVADDVIELRDNLNEAIFQASLKADPEHYMVLNTLRQTIVKHLTAVAESGVRLVEITPPETLSALLLAYRRFGDATRESEVVQRNRLRHPGFVPARPIKIAQR
ncbi:DNA circularization N-terminal domain-containing protein [Pseudomonas glycinae]|uniref:DNA circularization protein n=1 Tax=Pseudomonas glycinae TaxID=1785145 RepID=UPI0018D6E437|nr:DNA circularization N-terminal domain-containing protein [Pseudomonas glycinae]MBH3405691.1 DNA circularization N-terminal domain-containing protein [Pseudomonas glycinae]